MHLIAAELRRTPDLSDNWLAQILGTTDKTVAAVRQELIATSEIPKLDALRGKDGKYRRVTRIMTNTAKAGRERHRKPCRILGDDAPRKDWDLRLAQRKVKRMQKLEMTKGREVQPPGDGDIRLYHCPFQQLEEVAGIEPNSVHLILTDIPYGESFLPAGRRAWSVRRKGLGRGRAARHVQRAVPPRSSDAGTLDEHLTYRWIKCSHIRNDANLVHPYQILSFWKPILIYSKGDWKERRQWHDVSRVVRQGEGLARLAAAARRSRAVDPGLSAIRGIWSSILAGAGSRWRSACQRSRDRSLHLLRHRRGGGHPGTGSACREVAGAGRLITPVAS